MSKFRLDAQGCRRGFVFEIVGGFGDDLRAAVEQCRIALERVVLDLWRRGWMLDGKALAARITGMLDAVGSYQRAGKVLDFWPYFTASVNRYVGANAEEIQDQARSIGAQMGSILGALRQASEGPSLPELAAMRAAEVAKAKGGTLREKQSRLRSQEAADKAQLPLL